MPTKEPLKKSDGNVFRDLGFQADEAENLRFRSQLMMRIQEEIERREYTQAKAAEFFNVSQPRISDLMRGKIDLFSIDTLVNMLAAAGTRIELVFKDAA